MLSPARLHRQKITAQQASTEVAVGDEGQRGSAYDLMLDMLAQQKRQLKAVKSMAAKTKAKLDILPEWQDYINAVLEADTGATDSIIGQLMVWSIDVADYEQAIKLGEYMLKHDIALPEQFERDTADAFAEELATAWIKSDDRTITLEQLQQAAELVKNHELYDEVRAKLFRALGEAYHQAGDDKSASEYLDQAIKLNPKVGCKPLLNKLQAT